MVKQNNRNLLPLLAITALMLSVGLANYSQVSDFNATNTQSVLSESDEKDEDQDEDLKVEKEEDTKNEQEQEKEDIENKNDDNDDDNDSEIETESEFEQESETVSNDGQVIKFKLKSKTKIVNGKTVVETESGKIEVKNSPEDTISDLMEDGVIDVPVAIEAKSNREKVEFEVQGADSKKFLGIFNVVIPKTLTVSSETGEVLSTNQNFWSRILSLLSR